MAHNRSKHSTTEEALYVLERGWIPKLPKDNLNHQLTNIHPTSPDFKKMIDIAKKHAAKCVQEAVEYKQKRWDKSQKEPYFKIGERVLVSTTNFTNLAGNRKLRPSFVGPLTINKGHGNNAVEVILSDEIYRKHPVFSVSLIKNYHPREGEQTLLPAIPFAEENEKDKGKIGKILKGKKERINGKDVSLYLVGYKGESTDQDEWLPENKIPDGTIHLRKYRANKRH